MANKVTTSAAIEEKEGQFPASCAAVGNPMPSNEAGVMPIHGTKRKLEQEGEESLGGKAESKFHRAQEQMSEATTRSALSDLSDASLDGILLMSPSPRPDLYVHVSQSGILDLRQKLTQGQQIGQEDVHKILHRRQSITVPLDIRGAGSPFLDLPSPTDLDDVFEKLGAHDMAEGLVKALEFAEE